MKAKPKHQFRQGDILVERVASLPEKLTPVKREGGRMILAHGEVTGHCHAVSGKGNLLKQDEGVSYLKVAEALALLEHDEHSTVELPEGLYRVTRQREYSPEAIRNVAD